MGDVEGISDQRIVVRSLVVWLLLIVAEIVHGVLRAILLVPMVGEFRSNQIGVFTGSAIIVLIAFFTLRWIGATRKRSLFLVGSIWERLVADYNVVEGGLMPLGLLVLFFSPVIASRLSGGR